MKMQFFEQFKADAVMYEEFMAILEQHGLRDGKAVVDHLRDQVELRGDSVAVVDDENHITWRELYQRSTRLAAALQRRGVEYGDRVAFQVSNGIDWYVARLGIALAGGVTVLIFPKFRDKEVSYIVSKTEPKVYIGDAPVGDYDNVASVRRLRNERGFPEHIIVVGENGPDGTESFSGLIDELNDLDSFRPQRIDPDLPDQLATSSGTTGAPKIFYHVQHARKGLAKEMIARYGVTDQDRVLNLTPMQMGIGEPWAFWVPLLVGATAIQSSASNPEQQLAAIRELRPTIVASVPTQLAKMALTGEFDADVFKPVRFITNAGSPMPPPVQQIFEDKRIPVVSNYGNNETGTCCLIDPEDPVELRIGYVGKVAKYATVMVVDETGAEVPPGTVGEIIWQCHGLPFAYYQDRPLTEKSLGFGGGRPGWVHSNDAGVMDKAGNLRVTGRIDDMIIRGGENIFPAEVENELVRFEALQAISVIGMPDQIFGERVCAYVVPKNGAVVTLDDLKSFAHATGLAKFKWPERVEIVDELPLNSAGKVMKSELRRDIEAKLKG